MSVATTAVDLQGHTLPVTAEQFCEQYAPAVCRFAAMAVVISVDGVGTLQSELVVK
jgi:hypothetical protein